MYFKVRFKLQRRLKRNANSLGSMYLEIKNELNETPEIFKRTQEMDKGRLI